MKKFITRLLAPIAYWISQLRRPSVKTIKFPAELLPLLEVGTVAMAYCEFQETKPEDLALSVKLQSVVEGNTDDESMQFVSKILSGNHVPHTTYDWLVALGDAREFQRDHFMAYWHLTRKTSTAPA